MEHISGALIFPLNESGATIIFIIVAPFFLLLFLALSPNEDYTFFEEVSIQKNKGFHMFLQALSPRNQHMNKKGNITGTEQKKSKLFLFSGKRHASAHHI